MNITYSTISPKDYPAIKELINNSFQLYRYVDNESVLESWLNLYLQSCLLEQTFSCVAKKDNRVVGIIMGQAKKDYHISKHLKPLFALIYHTIAQSFKSIIYQCNTRSYKQMHQVYKQLLAQCNVHFDGVLTLFAVNEDCRGFGLGKELLNRLHSYQKKYNVKNFYLHTDSTCNTGFYENSGFECLGKQKIQIERETELFEMTVYLYGYMY